MIHFQGRKKVIIPNERKKEWDSIFGKRKSLETKDILDVFLSLGYDIYVMPKQKPNPFQINLLL